jgi:hypothetical protein
LQKLALLFVEFEQFEVIDQIIGIGLILDQCLDGSEYDSCDAIPFLFLYFDEFYMLYLVPLIFI